MRAVYIWYFFIGFGGASYAMEDNNHEGPPVQEAAEGAKEAILEKNQDFCKKTLENNKTANRIREIMDILIKSDGQEDFQGIIAELEQKRGELHTFIAGKKDNDAQKLSFQKGEGLSGPYEAVYEKAQKNLSDINDLIQSIEIFKKLKKNERLMEEKFKKIEMMRMPANVRNAHVKKVDRVFEYLRKAYKKFLRFFKIKRRAKKDNLISK